MKIEEIFGKDFDNFCEVDPFNPSNEVAGFISRKSNEYYGALVITHINGEKVKDQLIMGSPKMHYPFTTREDGTRNYNFPPAKEIEIFEKIDGTNILGFRYSDGDYSYTSYKTRLRPFLNPGSKWGNFYAMWLEVAGGWLDLIEGIMEEGQCNLSFELYGARNPHLVMYKEPLTFALLFGVTSTGRILSPTRLRGVEELNPLPVLKVLDKNYEQGYTALQNELNAGLTQIEDGYYTGREGTVWYLYTPDGRCAQLKCKPEIIEAIHFSAGAKNINKQVVLATCWNALENVDTLTVDFVKQLLLEEFKPELIEASHHTIEKCIDFVHNELRFRQNVLAEYQRLGLNITLQKAEVMRTLSSKFPKKEMRKVYSTIINFAR